MTTTRLDTDVSEIYIPGLQDPPGLGPHPNNTDLAKVSGTVEEVIVTVREIIASSSAGRRPLLLMKKTGQFEAGQALHVTGCPQGRKTKRLTCMCCYSVGGSPNAAVLVRNDPPTASAEFREFGKCK